MVLAEVREQAGRGCPGHTTTYTDVEPDGTHTADINALAALGMLVDTECGPAMFCPHEPMKRWTMVIWLIRMDGTDPTIAATSRFQDVEGRQWWTRYVEDSPTAASPSAAPSTHPATASTNRSPEPRWPVS